MYRYEEVEVFRALISQCNQNRTIAINGNGERKIPPSMANNLLEHVNSNYMFPRPRREVYSKRNFFPKTRVQEKILYKKPPFTLRNQPKFHSQSPLPAGYSGQGLVPNTYARVVSQSTPRASYHAAPQVAYQSGPAQVQYAGAPVAQPSVLSQPGTNVGHIVRQDRPASYTRSVSPAPVATVVQRDGAPPRASYTRVVQAPQPSFIPAPGH